MTDSRTPQQLEYERRARLGICRRCGGQKAGVSVEQARRLPIPVEELVCVYCAEESERDWRSRNAIRRVFEAAREKRALDNTSHHGVMCAHKGEPT